MKKIQITLFCFILGILCMESFPQQSHAYIQRQKRTEWFRHDRFGMFIHWGIYAIPARGEWVRNKERLTLEDYQPYFDKFNPVNFDPTQWAKIAKAAGMKYAVITAKHHDGFCMWDSEFTEYKVTNTPYQKDILKMWVEAFRNEGLKVGFYYSLIDWHHPDYPNVGNHPMHGDSEWDKKKYNFDNYLTYMHNQVKELLSNYGKIDIMWFDYSFGEYSGEKWKATELVKMVRKIQPDILIDNRLGGNPHHSEPEVYAGDFEGPEQVIPSYPMLNENGYPIPWELCLTLNNHWGYAANDFQYKSSEEMVRILVNCVSKGGNLLLNVGPDALGEIPEESVKILKGIGKWMKENGESIYGCSIADYPTPEWGRYTQNGNILYAHIMMQMAGQICLSGLKGKIESATLLRDGSEVQVSGFWLGDRFYIPDDDIFINFGMPVQHTYRLPDKVDTVVKIVLKE